MMMPDPAEVTAFMEDHDASYATARNAVLCRMMRDEVNAVPMDDRLRAVLMELIAHMVPWPASGTPTR